MEYRKLGTTGMEVSRLCLGCMGYGSLENGGIPGKTGEADARPIIKHALESGINFFDTANYYSRGVSEQIVGKALNDLANRDEVVVATKLYYPMFDGRNAKGLSRKSILAEIDHSLERLGMDYVDLYIIHRWDFDTPIGEVMEALNDVVRSGKARYIGASAMYAWQFMQANDLARERGWARFVSMQDTINLIYREEEKEMVPMCVDQGIAVTPFSPLAHGVFNKPADAERTDGVGKLQSEFVLAQDRTIIERAYELAARRDGATANQVALAWLLSKGYVTSALVGATRAAYLDDALAGAELGLTAEEVAYLEEPYVPHAQYGFRTIPVA